MELERFVTFREYYDPKQNLRDRLRELGDLKSFPDHNAEGVDAAVMGFVLRYLAEYLNIHDVSAEDLRQIVWDIYQKKDERENPGFLKLTLKGLIEGKTDNYGVQTLADMRSTAAIVKEIAFNHRFEESDEHHGVDLGSGTGILTAAMAVAAQRNGARHAMFYLLDSQVNALRESERVLSEANVQTRTIETDLRNSEAVREKLSPLQVQQWVSETIGPSTPTIKRLDPTGVAWNFGTHLSEEDVQRSGAFDPYPYVLHNLLTYTHEFHKRVMDGSAAFFPNALNGDFMPRVKRSTLRLHTGSTDMHRPLSEVRNDFREYEDFGLSHRW